MCDREGCVVASLVDEGHPLIWPAVVDTSMASGRQTSWLIESAVEETGCAQCTDSLHLLYEGWLRLLGEGWLRLLVEG